MHILGLGLCPRKTRPIRDCKTANNDRRAPTGCHRLQNHSSHMTVSFSPFVMPIPHHALSLFPDASQTVLITPSDSNSNSSQARADLVYSILGRALGTHNPLSSPSSQPLLTSFTRITAKEGTVLWEQDSPPDGLYLIESGVLRASYSSPDRDNVFAESMVGGTFAGELSALSNSPRNSRVVVEKDAVVWRLSIADIEKLEDRHPELARRFIHLVLKVAKTDYDILLSALAARQ